MSHGALLDAAVAAQAACDAAGLPNCIIGGIALQRWGEPRFTADIVLAGLDYEARVIERASFWDIGGGARLRTCSAEDLLVMKSFAGRDKDWADVTGILERQGTRLDLERVRRELAPLVAAKEEPDLMAQLERRIAAHLRP